MQNIYTLQKNVQIKLLVSNNQSIKQTIFNIQSNNSKKKSKSNQPTFYNNFHKTQTHPSIILALQPDGSHGLLGGLLGGLFSKPTTQSQVNQNVNVSYSPNNT